MKTYTKTAAQITAVVMLMTATFLSAQSKAKDAEPVAWGQLSGNTACVIFAEGRKTSGRFYGIAATTKTQGKLTVVEAQNYTPDQKEILETQENLDDLMRKAQKDHVKFVKIPEKYSPELLEKARASCKGESQ